MSSEQDRLSAILNYRVPKTTVYPVAQELNESNGNLTPLRKTQDLSKSKKRTPEFLQELQERINDDPGTSMRDLTAKMNVDEKTIRAAIHEDLRSKSYVLKVRQMLSEVSTASIVVAVASMNRKHLVNACTRFRSRLEAVIEADGGWLE
ncbi:Uncharacterized protein FKW44_010592 [Caligus rogercresseyi]|uniref:Uncharacterized protein n=1 Tax=Caligus rogercresseyi TaxID=217165 RepID=A0A7T8HGT2_CALRO|nr:Uncharacterized protein FKW44_010592 [Caligus rogercresseyi]